ncbi:hypothetical protein HPB50_004078 [Hyalomma asiaticum]|uniref:Uncharacterized protein n=1 Tax=Hyalomma asiaticum TaxID=266040 RepID=A0ACB7T6Y8_HYAAI|nr:hypothetical protein HPB50_004078 [Hyalomma asiaticum]
MLSTWDGMPQDLPAEVVALVERLLKEAESKQDLDARETEKGPRLTSSSSSGGGNANAGMSVMAQATSSQVTFMIWDFDGLPRHFITHQILRLPLQVGRRHEKSSARPRGSVKREKEETFDIGWYVCPHPPRVQPHPMHRRQPWHRKQQFLEGQDVLEYVLLVSGVLSFQFVLALLSYAAERYHSMPEQDRGSKSWDTQEERPLADRKSVPRFPDVREQAAYLYDLLPEGFRNSTFALKLRRIAQCGRRGNPCVRLDAGPFRLIEDVDLAEFAEWKRARGIKEASGHGTWKKARQSAVESTPSFQGRAKLHCQEWTNGTYEGCGSGQETEIPSKAIIT